MAVGDVVALLEADEDMDEGGAPPLGLVQAMWQESDGRTMVQLRSVARGCETVLGDAASDAELFVAAQLITRCAL